MTTHEAECVAMKRQGAKHVAKLLAGKSQQEQLEFWRQRTDMLLDKQAKARSTSEVARQ